MGRVKEDLLLAFIIILVILRSSFRPTFNKQLATSARPFGSISSETFNIFIQESTIQRNIDDKTRNSDLNLVESRASNNFKLRIFSFSSYFYYAMSLKN